jgi:hypothetical protein
MRSVLLVDDDDNCNFIMFRTLKSFVSDLEILTVKNVKRQILFTTNLKIPFIIFFGYKYASDERI